VGIFEVRPAAVLAGLLLILLLLLRSELLHHLLVGFGIIANC